MTISWATDDAPVADTLVERAIEVALEHGGRPGLTIDVVFCDAAYLTELHARHLDDPTPTDVITFDLGDEGGGAAGELYVSVERAREVAEARGGDPARELLLYVAHGVLHLCGYDDHADEDRRAMRAAEANVLALLGYPPEDATLEHDF
jgi:probable rRNA maturation factor